MAKKDFTNVSMEFFSPETIEKVDGSQAAPPPVAEQDAAQEAGAGEEAPAKPARKRKITDPPGSLTLDPPPVAKRKRRNPPRHPDAPETKSRRVQSLIKPSTYRNIEAIAEKEDLSVNEVVNWALTYFVENYE